MSYSWTTFDELVTSAIRYIKPKRVLDVGAGDGKYGALIKSAGLEDCVVSALECDPRPASALSDSGNYNEVVLGDALGLFEKPDATYDTVILGDVIEHLRHSDGKDLLEFLNYRASWIVIVTPECMPMNAETFYVGHNSLWRPDAMRWHDLWAHVQCGVMHLYIVRGLLDFDSVSLEGLVEKVNGAKPTAWHHQTGQRTPVSLTLNDSVFREVIDGRTIQYRPA